MAIRKARILILCKTYPSPSAKHTETSCVAGMEETGRLIRLYPVPFRLIDDSGQFRKWQWITAMVESAGDDRRPESHRIKVDTIHIDGDPVPTKDGWSHRRSFIDQLPIFDDFAALETTRLATGQSLGLLKPARITGLETGMLRRHHDPALGLAVALPGDELTTAVVPRVFVQAFTGFVVACRQAITTARVTPEQPAYHPLTISDLSAYGIEDAIPVVVAPSAATLFVGAPRLAASGQRSFRLSLSFDHRILNGAGAASFLSAISRTLRCETRLRARLAAPGSSEAEAA